jgi:hypothetical protein
MKMKSWLLLLPLGCIAGGVAAQYAGPDAAPAPAASVAGPDTAQMPAPERAARSEAQPRQGADMRHCLDRKTLRAIIRCAEPGRKP